MAYKVRKVIVSDGEDLSTLELIRRIHTLGRPSFPFTHHASHVTHHRFQGLNRPARLFSFPPAFLHLAGRLTGRSATVDRLLNSLVIDSAKIRRDLNWTPPYSMDPGLAETAKWFKRQL